MDELLAMTILPLTSGADNDGTDRSHLPVGR